MAESTVVRNGFAVERLNHFNYQTWKQKAEFVLINEDLWEVISEPAPIPEDVRWRRKDQQARAVIGLLIENNQLIHIRSATSALETWEALKSVHNKSSFIGKVFVLKRISRASLEKDGDMEKHVNLMLGLFDEMASMGKALDEDLMVAFMLTSLPAKYDGLITALEVMDEKELTVKFIKDKLLNDWKRRQEGNAQDEPSEAVMKASVSNNSGGNFQKNGQKNKVCFWCKTPGHYKKECRQYLAWKKDKEKANNVKHEKSDNELCLMVYDEKNPTISKQIKACSVADYNEDIWIIDSGATSHMAHRRDFFTHLNQEVRDKVRLANGDLTEVKGVGSGTIKLLGQGNKVRTVKVENVLYVPKLETNLLSVKGLTKKGHKIKFEGNECIILYGNTVIAEAIQISGLYVLKTEHRACIGIQSAHSPLCQHMWHRRFGHRELAAIKDLENKDLASGIKIVDCGIKEVCDHCVKGKMTRKPFPKETTHKTKAILDLIHTDVCGPMQTSTPAGKRYLLTIIDDYSRFTKVCLMEQKSETKKFLKEFVESMKTLHQKKPKIIRSDRGREYIDSELTNYLKEEGIKIQYTASYTPEQNGVAERKNRTLIEMVRCMLFDTDMDKKFWGEAVNTANYLQNRLPSRSVSKTPYELWFKQSPNVKNLQVFGCKAFMHIPKQQRRKLDEKAQELIFVGYSEESKAYRLLDKHTNTIKISRDVIFSDSFEKNNSYINIEFKPIKEIRSENDPEEEGEAEKEEEEEEEPNVVKEKAVDKVRRSKRENKGVPPDRYMGNAYTVASMYEDPRNRNEALAGVNKDKWKKAMDEEMESLLLNNTWELVQRPKNKNIISCKWVFKTKRNSEGQVNKFKARLVARGFSQKYGEDYDEVFAPVVRHTTFRVMLTIAGQDKLIVVHYDAKTAFLNGQLKETIYMRQPEGYAVKDKEEMVCKLIKSIYGLKQAAKAWNDHLDDVLKSDGFQQSEADPCLYVKYEIEEIIYVVVYVDDFLIACKKRKPIEKTANNLKEHFTLSNLGEIRHYLGVQVIRDNNGIFWIHQGNYIDQILARFGLHEAKTSSIPLDPGFDKIEEQVPMKDSEKYQQLIGALLYISVNTRPDITASVCILSQYNKQPTETTWNEAKRIARYLKGTKNLWLKLGNEEDEERELYGYSDADWAQSKKDRKSNSGHIYKYNGSLISWGCKKQNSISLSTMEAEYIALAEACQEGLWIQRLLKDFGKQQRKKTVIYEDNQSCLKFILNSKFSNRTKHIDTKYHFVKDLKNRDIMDFKYCPTEHMLADMLTKPMGAQKLSTLREKNNLLVSQSLSLRKGVEINNEV